MTSPASISTQSHWGQAFDPRGNDARRLQGLDASAVIGYGADMHGRTTRRDDHVIGERRFSTQIDGDDVLGLGFVQAGENLLHD